MESGEGQAVGQERVWDVAVRVFHWSLVISFFIAYFTEDDLLWLHVWAGYVVGGLIVFRIIWGLAGTRHARFSDFIYGPLTSLRYFIDLFRQRAKRYVGHSPAGSVMVFALLIGLAVTVWSGMETYAIEKNAGPLAGFASALSIGGGVWRGVHEIIANLMIFLVVLHILGVALASFAHRENLVRAMITGMKRR